ncbi:MAG: sensor histidine kinase [Actinomycetota bacterium]|nr:sensor histidine kinase [Actinomycetota bacterium]
MSRRLSLAGQFLLFQLAIVFVVVLAVAAASMVQSDLSFTRAEGRRMLAVAETVADTPAVVAGLSARSLSGGIPGAAENVRSQSGASYVIVTDRDGSVVWSPYPQDVNSPLRRLQPQHGPSWVGEAAHNGAEVVEARVPVLADGGLGVPVGRLLGYAVVGQETPSVVERLEQAAPALLIYVGIAGVLGVFGSLLLSRRVKRQTLGLEPDEITRLVEHREAMLHGLKEAVVGVDRQGVVTLLNDEACRLLGVGVDAVGRHLDDLPLQPVLAEVLGGTSTGRERVVPSAGRVLVLNRMPLRIRGRSVGWVTTLRDRTDLVDLQRELDVSRGMTDALRAQAHEFTNRLHTIAGLVELEEYDEVVRFVELASRSHHDLVSDVTSRIEDPAVAALLVAKASRAGELSVDLTLSPESRLGRVDDALSADIVTVVGNLVDNALDALGRRGGKVTVSVRADEEVDAVLVRVRDTGPGVDPEFAQRVFVQGFSTKTDDGDEPHGWGLALTWLVCERRGGDVAVSNDGGAVFEARLPRSAPVRATAEERT